MKGASQTAQQPVLDEATRSFVRRSLHAGLLEVGDIKKVVVSLLEESDKFSPQRLADGLIGAGVLTQWQANKLLAGKARGFFLGSYRLLRPLGKGGMGVVYLGEHHVMKRLMALKILPPEATDDERRIERFKAEARACAQLDHPNIVCAYDFAEAGDKLYIVMEYVDGIDLHQLVHRDGPMAVSDVIDVIRQATQGLAHAHERGIIHRDLKPSNLMLRTDGVVKVSDLGLARVGWADGEEDRKLMGTTDFLAPEQAINSKAVDARADTYALGCTMYYLLTGETPFDGTPSQRLAKHQTAPVPDIRAKRKDCPAAVAELLTRMMSKRPDDRPKSAVELLAQLRRLSGSASDSTPGTKLNNVAPVGDSGVDDTLYQASIDDTSLSSDGELPVEVALEDFDFGALPPVSAESESADDSPLALPPTSPLMQPAIAVSGKNVKSSRKSIADSQQLLLGVGLAMAVLALVAVIFIAVRSVSQPLPQQSPMIKKVEESSGGQVIIVRE